jgi:uncharacterized protein (TIGR02646 family)
MLPRQTQAELDQYQQIIDAIPEYKSRVELAVDHFSKYNRKGHNTFEAVKAGLTAMCSGARRCGYCEDSVADEVEHIKPKSLYPEATFVWLNYLYVCGSCNTRKNNKFAVFDSQTGKLVDVQRKPRASMIPPRPGMPVIIDPRTEDPCDFLWLELQSTFYFFPRRGIELKAHERAQYTIDILKLNDRAYLPQSRAAAFRDYVAQLKQYRTDREEGAPEFELRRIETHIRERQHPTVWSEMKRQHASIPVLKKLFSDVPEALAW